MLKFMVHFFVIIYRELLKRRDYLQMKKYLAIFFIFILLICEQVYGASLAKDLQKKLEKLRTVSTVYDVKGELIGNLYYYRRVWLSVEKISPSLQKAVIAIEDKRFYKHNGVDLQGILRALWRNIVTWGKRMEGGSTITQQLAKIALLSSERTLARKLQDIEYAMDIEKTYTKAEILEFYLNNIYMAHGNVGVEAASRYYFNKSAANLEIAESALLAAVINSPENYSPFKHPKAAKKRRNIVLQKMLEQKYITKAQYQKAYKAPLGIVPEGTTTTVGGYFLDYIREWLLATGYTEEELRFSGYKVYTTLNLDYQKKAEAVMRNLPKPPTKKLPQGALVMLDPRNGGVLAMVGGRDYNHSQLNRAVNAYRQPGSALKPFVYATALEKGFTAASLFEDKPLEIELLNGEIWTPNNYDKKYRGSISLRGALRESVNTVAVQLLQEIGIEAVVEQMERMGIKSLVKTGRSNDLALAPLALGGLTKGVSLLELAAAYTPFPGGGNYVEPWPVKRIMDQQGNLLRSFQSQKHSAISGTTAYIMTLLMKDVVLQGTGKKAMVSGWPIAGKTGTSSDYTNAWFVGYTPQLVTAVWLGNDQQEVPMRYPTGNIGSATAAAIWSSYMKQILTAKTAPVDFKEPPGIVWADVNPRTGQVVPKWTSSDSYQEVFAENSIPQSGIYKIWRFFFPGKRGE